MKANVPGFLSPVQLRQLARVTRLPAIQRGSVWRPQQVEELWDSILRGFPIGSFLLTRYNQNLGERILPLAQNAGAPEYYLLDGQQRWNAILLGFENIWASSDRSEADTYRRALWIDLAAPDRRPNAPEFLFRVVTGSHPWGYSRDNPRDRLKADERRAALDSYRSACRSIPGLEFLEFRPGRLPLAYAWPWDAEAPVPFAFVLDAASKKDDVWNSLARRLRSLPYWDANQELKSKSGNWKQTVLDLLRNPTQHMGNIINAVRRNMGFDDTAHYQIPVQLLPEELMQVFAQDQEGPQQEERDPVETLFIRVNSGGTPLVDEELKYSLLKHCYPRLEGIENALGARVVSPARLVTLVSRLILARTDEGRGEPPREPNVARFRRLIGDQDQAGGNFREKIECYLGLGGENDITHLNSRISVLLDGAKRLLSEGDWSLPPVLVAGLASYRKSDAFFLLLTWLDGLIAANPEDDPLSRLNDEDKRRIVGAVTTLGWFAENPQEACVRQLWPRLQHPPAGLEQFFSPGSLMPCLEADRGQLPLIPPLPPNCLQPALQEQILNRQDFNEPNGELWNSDWNQWSNLNVPESAKQWYRQHNIAENVWERIWHRLVGKLWDMRDLVLYGQREVVRAWFPDFDPTAPDQLEDTDCPWDFDHIHPSSYGGVNNVPRIIKEWHKSTGNLRAWPLEANRGRQDVAPRTKLDQPNRIEQAAPYNLADGEAIRRASCVAEGDEWKWWHASTPDADGHRHNYLVYPEQDDYGPCRPALIRAITLRWVALYRSWYETLRVGTLFDG